MFSEAATYRDEDLFFNGIYQVVKVESKFDNGQFLQTLTCVRMNNQQGEGAPAILQKAADRDFSVKKGESENPFSGLIRTRKGFIENTKENITTKAKDGVNEVINKTKNVARGRSGESR